MSIRAAKKNSKAGHKQVLSANEELTRLNDELRHRNIELVLVGMDERARLVGGTFSIQSEPKKRTCVEVRVPLRGREA
jgi:hypothetical protein